MKRVGKIILFLFLLSFVFGLVLNLFDSSSNSNGGAGAASDSITVVKLTDEQVKVADGLRKKYLTILKRYWGWEKFGRRGVSTYTFNLTKFEKDYPGHRGKFSNQFVFIEGNFKVTLTTGENQKIEVQLTK